jgi:hypothetical protein
MSINNKTAKECLAIIWQAFDKDTTAVIQLLTALTNVKGNQSFHDSMRLLLDLANSKYKDLVKEE